MDYIKSWYEYFRGKTADRSRETQTEELKNELLKLDGSQPPAAESNPNGERMKNEFLTVLMERLFDNLGSNSNMSDVSSQTDNFWPFVGDMFPSFNNTHRHKEYLDMLNEIQKDFSLLQNIIFQDSSFQTSQDCSRCDGPQRGESLSDYYLRVPDFDSLTSDNKIGVINPENDVGGKISLNLPHFHESQQIVSMSYGPDGVLEITKITKDSNGKMEKTVTKVDLNGKM